ncbi:MAG TPA: PAS domain-containing protein, partial [bacterium]|nr:PAS domain-containing protein [bacterium]
MATPPPIPVPPEAPRLDRRRTDHQEHRRRRREMWLIGVVSLAIAGFTFFELRLSAFSDGLPATNNFLFFGLVNLNVILTLLLVFLVFRNAAKLIFDRRSNVMGSRLRTKLVLAIVGFTLIPSVLLFSVTTSFVVNSVNRWFDPFVDRSLKDALKMAELVYQRAEAETSGWAAQMAHDITDGDMLEPVAGDGLRRFVQTRRDDFRLAQLEVVGIDGRSLARADSPDDPADTFPALESDFLAAGQTGRSARTQPLDKADVIRGIAPVLPRGCLAATQTPECRARALVVVTEYFPTALVAEADRLDKGFEGYQQLKIYSSPLTTSYVTLLTTITLVVIFAASWLGLHMAKGIAVPLKNLADGAKAVSAGDLDVSIDDSGADEIGQVVKAFNKMTADLRTSREKVETANRDLTRSNFEIEQRRRYMEVVLTNIAAGVIALDSDGRIRAMNDAAARLLVADREQVIGKRYREVLPESYMEIARELLKEIEDESIPQVSRQVSISINGEARTVMVNVTPLRDPKSGYVGLVVLLDDL